VGSGALRERGPERLGSAGCRFGSGGASGARGSVEVRELAGSVGEQVGSAVREVGSGGGARFGDAPARSAVRGPDRGGGTVRQPGSNYIYSFLSASP
jgi:hypothetical protein